MLAEQHTVHPDPGEVNDSYLLVWDSSAIYDIPGAPHLGAIHITRDFAAGTYRIASARLPLECLAQNWLIQRGADWAKLRVTETDFIPADAATREIEERLRLSASRYQIIDDYSQGDGFVTWVVALDTQPDDAALPYRGFIQQYIDDTNTYTLREGAFPSEQAALAWLDDPTTPLPAPPTPPAQRSTAALTRTGPVQAPAAPAPPQAAGPAPTTRPPRR